MFVARAKRLSNTREMEFLTPRPYRIEDNGIHEDLWDGGYVRCRAGVDNIRVHLQKTEVVALNVNVLLKCSLH